MDTEISMSSTKCDQKSKTCAPPSFRKREHARGIVNAIGSRAIREHLPRRRARARVVEVRVECFGDALQEDRVLRIARIERLQDVQTFVGLVLVPHVNLVPLEVRLSAKEIAGRLKKHEFRIRKAVAHAERYSRDELDAAIIRLAELDAALKGASRVSNELELERALLEITAAREPVPG